MKVCLLVEGAYPYVRGGVASWIQQLMTIMPEIEFVLQLISAKRDEKKSFQYEIPDNVVEIRETYLLDDDYVASRRNKKIVLSQSEYDAFESLMFGENPNWQVIFDFFNKKEITLNGLICSEAFFQMTTKYYKQDFKRIAFSDFMWTLRSLYLPLFTILKTKSIKADVYHCVSTGYAGILGCMNSYTAKKPLIISEHGIYTREREEEIIKADWVKGIYKNIWINQFHKLSSCCYEKANIVTSLFQEAREYQHDLGCDQEKTIVVPNGVKASLFENIKQKEEDDTFINVGAVLRVAPIKDVKTMISAFAIAKRRVDNLKLWIMGPLDESPQYVRECKQLVKELHVEDVIFTGAVVVKDYIGKMDILLLSSLSEGQPLAILEGFAAKKPSIVTNVGNCAGLIEGESDTLGKAGVVVPVMNATKMAEGIIKLAEDEELRVKMGETGYRRAIESHNDYEVYMRFREMYYQLRRG